MLEIKKNIFQLF